MSSDKNYLYPPIGVAATDKCSLELVLFCGFGLVTCLLLLSMIIEGKLDTAALVVPLVVVCQLLVVAWIGRHDLWLFVILSLGMVLKLAAAWLYAKTFAFGDTDVAWYFAQGTRLASGSVHLKDLLEAQPLWGTNVIPVIAACLLSITGCSLMAAVVLFALASYWGQYLLYRAYCLTFPGKPSRSAAGALFLWPSLVFWPATLGKDALVLLFISIMAIGYAMLSTTKKLIPCLLVGFGIITTFVIRPHIGLLLVFSVALAHIFHIGKVRSGIVIGRWLLVCTLALSTIPVAYLCAQLFNISNTVEATKLSNSYFEGNQTGGSTFDADTSVGLRLLRAPLLLTRPFPWESNGAPAALSSLEGVVLVMAACIRRRGLVILVRSARTNRFILFALVFTTFCLLLLSVVLSNFGLLARQRVMILPFVLIMLVAAKYDSTISAIPSIRQSG